MYDEKKIKRFKTISAVIIGLVVLIVGYSIGNYTANVPSQPKTTTKSANSSKNELSRETLEKFDLAFFTKKDLGENRNRYKSLMTEAMYNQEVAEENKPVNQAYKGMIVDQALKSEQIYIDTKDKTAIVDVEYTNTQLKDPGNLKTALKDQDNHATLKLTFIKQGGKYLVNEIDWISLVDSSSDSNTSGDSADSNNSSMSSSSSVSDSTSNGSNPMTSNSSTSSSSSSSEDDGTNTAHTVQLW